MVKSRGIKETETGNGGILENKWRCNMGNNMMKMYKLGAILQFEKATFIGKTTESLTDKTRFIVRGKDNVVYTVTGKHVLGVIDNYRQYYEAKATSHEDKARKLKSLEVLKVYLMSLQYFPLYFSTKLLREVTSPEIFSGQVFKEAHAKENARVLKDIHYAIGVLSTIIMQYCLNTLTIQNMYQIGHRDLINPNNFTSTGEGYDFIFKEFAERGHIRYLEEEVAVTDVTIIEAIVQRVITRYGISYGVDIPSVEVKANPKLEDVITIKDEETEQVTTEINVDMPEVISMDELGVISVTIGAQQLYPTTLTIYTLSANDYIVFLKSQGEVLSVQVGKSSKDDYYSGTTLDLITAMTDCLKFPTNRRKMPIKDRSTLNPNSRGTENQKDLLYNERKKAEQLESIREQERINELERELNKSRGKRKGIISNMFGVRN